MLRTGNKTRRIRFIMTLVLVLMLFSAGFTLSYFSGRSQGGSSDLGIGTLTTLIKVNDENFAENLSLDISTLSANDAVVDSVIIKTDEDSVDGYLRVKVEYVGLVDNDLSLALATALNLEQGALGYNTYSGGEGYSWQYLNGYYYLVDNGELVTITEDCEGFVLFENNANHETVYFPDISNYNIDGASLSGITFNIYAQAIQEHDNISSATEMRDLIGDKNIFREIQTPPMYIIQYNTMGGVKIPTSIVNADKASITLPQVNGESVSWYSNYANGVYSNAVGISNGTLLKSAMTGSMTLYAKYQTDKIAVMFEKDDLTTGNLPTPGTVTNPGNPNVVYIDYNAQGGVAEIDVTATLAKTGYTYSSWAVDEDVLRSLNPDKNDEWINSHLSYTASANIIELSKDIVGSSMAITLHPNWQVQTYTAVFDPNGGDLTDYYKELEENSTNVYTYHSIYNTCADVYTYNYNIETNFEFPAAELANKTFQGWLVDVGGGKWRRYDSFGAGEIGTNYTGNVTFIAQWGELVYTTETTSADFVINGQFTLSLSNTTGRIPTYSVVRVDEFGSPVLDANDDYITSDIVTIASTSMSSCTLNLVKAGRVGILAEVVRGGLKSKAKFVLTVNPRSFASVVVTGIENEAYTGSAITQNMTLTDGLNTLIENTHYTVEYANNVNVGTATITITGIGGYTGEIERTFTITTRAITITANNQTITYGESITTTVNDIDVTSGTLVSGHVISSVTLTQSTVNATNNGSVVLSGVLITTTDEPPVDVTNNYNITLVNGTLIINKADSTYTAPTAITGLVYTGLSQALINAGSATGGTMQYKVGSGEYGTSVPTGINAGTYTIYYKVVGDENHNDVAEASFTVTIAQATVNAPTPSQSTYTYNGTEQTYEPANWSSISDFVNKTNDTKTVIGTQEVLFTLKDTDNYKWLDLNTSANRTLQFTINRAEVQLPTASQSTYTYNGSAQTYEPANWSSISNLADISGNVQTSVDSYTVTISLKSPANSMWADSSTSDKTLTFTINPATISATVTGGTWTYDGNSHCATAQLNTAIVASGTATIYYGTTTEYGYSTTLTTSEINLSSVSVTNYSASATTVYYKITSSNYSDLTGNVIIQVNAKATNPTTLDINTGGITVLRKNVTLLAVLTDKPAECNTVTYAWYRSTDKSSWSTISGATSSTYTLTNDDVDNYIKVVATIQETTNYNGITLTYETATTCTDVTYTITFVQTPSSGGTTSVGVSAGQQLSELLITAPNAVTGYTFSGYYTEASGQGTIYFDGSLQPQVTTYLVGDDLTLYAYFTPTIYYITLDAGDHGSYASTPSAVAYTIETTVAPTLTSPTANTGYSFTGWQITSISSGSTWTNNSAYSWASGKIGDITLTAQWEGSVYTITLVGGANTTTSGTTTIYEKYGDGFYLNNNNGVVSNKIDTSTTGITPATKIYTITYNDYGDTNYNDTDYANYAFDFGGYWTGEGGTGNQIIGGTGKLYDSSVSTTCFTADGSLYAKWNTPSAKVLPTSPTPTKYNGSYVLDGWYDNSGLTGSAITTIAPETPTGTTIYAKWKETFITFSSDSQFKIKLYNSSYFTWEGSLLYSTNPSSTDANTWQTWTKNTTPIASSSITYNNKYVLYIRGTGNTKITGGANNYGWVLQNSDGTGNTYATDIQISCSGNISNLLDWRQVNLSSYTVGNTTYTAGTDYVLGQPTMGNNCYRSLFAYNTCLTSLPNLPAKTLSQNCYNGMFKGCTQFKASTTQSTSPYNYTTVTMPYGGGDFTNIVNKNAFTDMFCKDGGAMSPKTDTSTTPVTVYIGYFARISLDKNYGTGGDNLFYEKISNGTHYKNSDLSTNPMNTNNGGTALSMPTRTYTITFNSQGGSEVFATTYSYSCGGYYTSLSGGVQMIYANGKATTNLVNKTFGFDTTLYAHWINGSFANSPSNPTKAFYTFAGWYTDSSCTDGNELENAEIASSLTLYAKWIPVEYTITYYKNDGNTDPVLNHANLTENTDYKTQIFTFESNSTYLTNPFTRSGYDFMGWTDSYNSKVVITGLDPASLASGVTISDYVSRPLYAVWSSNSYYTVALNNNGGTTSGTTAVYVDTSTHKIYTTDDGNGAEMTTSSNSITAPTKSSTVTINLNGGSISANGSDFTQVQNSEDYYATATFNFEGYFDNTNLMIDSSSGYLTSNFTTLATSLNSGIELKAIWTPSATITLPTVRKGIVDNADTNKDNYVFRGWYADANFVTKVGNAGASYIPTAQQVTLYAKFDATFITFSSSSTFTVKFGKLSLIQSSGSGYPGNPILYYSTNLSGVTPWASVSGYDSTYTDANEPMYNISDNTSINAVKNNSDNKYYVYLRASNTNAYLVDRVRYAYNSSSYPTRKNGITFTGTNKTVSISGNIENILDYETVRGGNHPTMEEECFRALFACEGKNKGDTNSALQDASELELPATTLTVDCYRDMFTSCGNLETAMRVLPATTLATACYTSMFKDCPKLRTVPALPGEVVNDCYEQMFVRCTSLTYLPIINISSSYQFVYKELQTMFSEDSNLYVHNVSKANYKSNNDAYYTYNTNNSTLKYIEFLDLRDCTDSSGGNSAFSSTFNNTNSGGYRGNAQLNYVYYTDLTKNTVTNTARLNANDGSGASTNVTLQIGELNATPLYTILGTVPFRLGYKFKGYYDANGTNNDVWGTQYINENMELVHTWDKTGAIYDLYAKWEALTYTILFKSNDGNDNVKIQTFDYGTLTALLSNTFTNGNKVFDGWYTDSACTGTAVTTCDGAINGNTINETTITLYAKWIDS